MYSHIHGCIPPSLKTPTRTPIDVRGGGWLTHCATCRKVAGSIPDGKLLIPIVGMNDTGLLHMLLANEFTRSF
jgi:hypothetical protein